ncbi:hypothetical protein AQUCO_04200045v1 [Aquilegia coerulea]|uniref:Uncharacterized protein n=1 Tax=Aquilegia coerulea TaxID=218851 RepID=A0A2G5CP21_AQUCA|nr:hypothetical protein AQUCO_04200045v1 [Aquilegia coerulea]
MFSYCSTSTPNFSSSSFLLPRIQHKPSLSSSYLKNPKASSIICLSIGIENLAEITQNKVLVAATVSAAIGQLSKPFATSLIYGDNVDFRKVFRAGGFPSTHSSSVVAAATSLGLERGVSDSLFGMTVIYAALVMYDAQAVRREVGNHAKVLNKIIVCNKESKVDSNVATSIFTKSEALASLTPSSEKANTRTLNSANPPMYTSENRSSAVQSSLTIDSDPLLKEICNSTLVPLEESIGHTLTEVIAGGLLGFVVTLAVYNVM